MTGPRPTATSSISRGDDCWPRRRRRGTRPRRPARVLSAPSVLAPVWMVMCLPSSLPASAEISSSSSGQHARQHLDHGDRRAEAREDRRELDPHRARADDDQALRDRRSICRISSEVMIALPSGVRPGMLRGRDPVARMTFFVLTLGLAALALDDDAARALQPALALEERDLVLLEEVALDALAQAVHDAVSCGSCTRGEVEARASRRRSRSPCRASAPRRGRRCGGGPWSGCSRAAGRCRRVPAGIALDAPPSSGPSGRPGWRPRSRRARCRSR